MITYNKTRRLIADELYQRFFEIKRVFDVHDCRKTYEEPCKGCTNVCERLQELREDVRDSMVSNVDGLYGEEEIGAVNAINQERAELIFIISKFLNDNFYSNE